MTARLPIQEKPLSVCLHIQISDEAPNIPVRSIEVISIREVWTPTAFGPPRRRRVDRDARRVDRSMRAFSSQSLRLVSSRVSRRVVAHAPLKPSRLGSTTVRVVHSRSAACAIAGAPVVAVVVDDAHRATPALSKREINFPRLIATLSSRASRTAGRSTVARGVRSLRRTAVRPKDFRAEIRQIWPRV